MHFSDVAALANDFRSLGAKRTSRLRTSRPRMTLTGPRAGLERLIRHSSLPLTALLSPPPTPTLRRLKRDWTRVSERGAGRLPGTYSSAECSFWAYHPQGDT